MEYRKILVSLVAVIALVAIMAMSVSASDLGSISSIEVNGIEAQSGALDLAAFSGSNLLVKTIFSSDEDAQDVRVKAWISGSQDVAVSTERFDVIGGKTYSRVLTLPVPSDLRELNESFVLEVLIESKDGRSTSETVQLTVQRESYIVEVLDVSMDPQVKAGNSLALDIVLKNRGSHFADDSFVVASIPALGIERRAYFGDLSPVDQSNPDKEDAAERLLLLSIPSNAPAGVYLVQVQAFNADSTTTTTKKVAVVGASADSMVVSSANSKTFAAGDKATYSMTIVNSGDKVQVYTLAIDAPTGLTVDADSTVVAVPAGSSRTIQLVSSSDKAGKYDFNVNVQSNGQLVKMESYTSNVEGKSIGGNATVLLTVVLAIVFVVLLVVLIVLLTRKPQKTEEFGESYY